MKLLTSIALMMMSLAAWSADLVSNVAIRQVRPWQGMVEIRYELTEDISAGSCPTTIVTFSDREHEKTYAAKTFTHPFTYTKGEKRMIWNAAKDGISFKSTNVVCTVAAASDAGLYCVVDLSGGVNAESYPVTYLFGIPSGGWTDEYKTTKLVLRKIEPGTFTMGSPSDELWRSGNETPHLVTLTKRFYIGVFEVTQKQYELVMGVRPSHFTRQPYADTRPAECVSYEAIRGSSSGASWPSSNAVDEESFLGKIRAKTGLVFDLPTEAQWEYACRAGTTTALNSGKNLESASDEAADENMNKVGRYYHNGDPNYTSESDTSAGTNKVGSYEPNPWGLYDMHGNVLEWCLDWHQDKLGEAAVTDPAGATSGADRTMRGGHWNSNACRCRSARRDGYTPSSSSSTYGFRLSCSVGSAN